MDTLRKPITIVVACDAQNGIGYQNTIPWKLPQDMQHFRRTTDGGTVIMGRKTAESIGRPLPNRLSIVVSRTSPGLHRSQRIMQEMVSGNLEHAIHMAQQLDMPIFIIGGAQVYKQALPFADKIIMTRIEKVFKCDTFFPAMDHAAWVPTKLDTHYSDNLSCHYSFVTMERHPNRMPSGKFL
jgi:dihydrofolate reductase